MSTVAITDIRFDGGTQSRACISEQVVADYADAMQAGDQFPPIVVYFDGAAYWLADGFHRFQAYVRANVESVAADVRQGTQRDAILFSVGANASHGLRRTNDDKRRAVLTLLNDSEWAKWSDREIARRCAVDGKTVAGLRPKLTEEIRSERTYKTKHGTQAEMKTADIGKRAAAEKAPARSAVTSPKSPVPEVVGASNPVEAKLRREFRALTPDAQEDAYVGLSLDLQDCKAVTAKLKTERDTLKAQVKELGAADSTTVIRNLQVQVKNAESARWREGEKTAAALKQVHALKKELKALGREVIPL